MSGDSSFILKDSDPLLDPDAFQTPVGQGGGSVSSGKGAKYGSGGIGEVKVEKTPVATSSSSTSSLNKKIAYALGMTAIVGLVAVASVYNSHGGAYNSNDSMEVQGLTSIEDKESAGKMFGQTNLIDSNVDLEVIPSAKNSVALKAKEQFEREFKASLQSKTKLSSARTASGDTVIKVMKEPSSSAKKAATTKASLDSQSHSKASKELPKEVKVNSEKLAAKAKKEKSVKIEVADNKKNDAKLISDVDKELEKDDAKIKPEVKLPSVHDVAGIEEKDAKIAPGSSVESVQLDDTKKVTKVDQISGVKLPSKEAVESGALANTLNRLQNLLQDEDHLIQEENALDKRIAQASGKKTKMALLMEEKKEREELEAKLKKENDLINRLRKEAKLEARQPMLDAAARKKAEIEYTKKSQAELRALAKKPVVYPRYDPKKDHKREGYYFPNLAEKDFSETKMMKLMEDKNIKQHLGLSVSTDLPGAPQYMLHQRLNESSIANKNVLFWDMSRDAKVADYADGHYIIAAIESDALYYSDDSGRSFTSHGKSSGVRDWMAVTINYEGEKMAALVRGEDEGDITGDNLCYLIRSNDFGVTWTQSSEAGYGPYNNLVASYQGDTMYMTRNGDNPAIMRSTDEGNNWRAFQDFPVDPVRFVLLETDHGGRSVYAATIESSAGGFIFASSDRGETWHVMLEPGQKFYHGIYAQNWGDRAFFTAVDDTTVWYTRDVGKTVEIAGDVPYANASLCASFEQFGGGYIFAVKPGEYMYRSYDKGASWHRDVRSGRKQWTKCLTTSYATFDIVYARGDGFYSDRGIALPLTAEQIGYPYRYAGPTTPDNNVLTEVAMSPNGRLTLAGFGGEVGKGTGAYISEDRGDSWEHLSGLGLDQFESYGMGINNDGDIIGIIGKSDEVERNYFISRDGGKTFTSSDVTRMAQYFAHSQDMQHQYITRVHDPLAEEILGQIAVSHDYGRTFHNIQLNYTSFYMWTSIACSFDGQYVFATTFDTHGNGFIHRSHNFGEDWTEIPRQENVELDPTYPVEHLPVADWNMVLLRQDGEVVYAVKYMSNLIYKSTDFGMTWLQLDTSPDVFSSVCMSADGQKIMGTGEHIFVSYDGAMSWGHDTLSGDAGWLQCRLSEDGTLGAIRRYKPDVLNLDVSHTIGEETTVDDEQDEVPETTTSTAVYLNEPWPPTAPPSTNPTPFPNMAPTHEPSREPTAKPSRHPTLEPTGNPRFEPTPEPTMRPTSPTKEPTLYPTPAPTKKQTREPTLEPTPSPWANPTPEPSHEPTLEPTPNPTPLPTRAPLSDGTTAPVSDPTLAPIDIPTMEPTPEPSMTPTYEPTFRPSLSPSHRPHTDPTATPTAPVIPPTMHPSTRPSLEPTKHPVADPTLEPTKHPVHQAPLTPYSPTMEPSKHPVAAPTMEPSKHPAAAPTSEPVAPVAAPTKEPSSPPAFPVPSTSPTKEPSSHPAASPTMEPSKHPVTEPTHEPIVPNTPTREPSRRPVASPTMEPSRTPVTSPTKEPSPENTEEPTKHPSTAPFTSPTEAPVHTHHPAASPTFEPTRHPHTEPTREPIVEGEPTHEPTKHPVSGPTLEPTRHPISAFPTGAATEEPTKGPVSAPTHEPTHTEPTDQPTERPTLEPTHPRSTRHPSAAPTEMTDTDEDGIPDKDDECPTEFGPASNGGCPRTTEKPTEAPTEAPTVPEPTEQPTYRPTLEPTHPRSTRHPSAAPTEEPIYRPTLEPTHPRSSRHPSAAPTEEPSELEKEVPEEEEPEEEEPKEEEPEEEEPEEEEPEEEEPEEEEPEEEEPEEEEPEEEEPGKEEPVQEPTSEPEEEEPETDDRVGEQSEPLPVPCESDSGTSTFCPGKLPATVARVHLEPGCILLSVNDLTTINENPKYDESAILVICSSKEGGVVKVDEKVLTDFDMIFMGDSMISSVIFGPDTKMKIYETGDFTGTSLEVTPQGDSRSASLRKLKFGEEKDRTANDLIKSFEFTSESEDLNSCEDAMQVYYFKSYLEKLKKMQKKRLRTRY